MKFKFNYFTAALLSAGFLTGCVNTLTQANHSIEQTNAPEIRTEIGDKIIAENAFNERVLENADSSADNSNDLNLDADFKSDKKLTAGEAQMLNDPTITVTPVVLNNEQTSASAAVTENTPEIKTSESSVSNSEIKGTSILESKNAYIRWRDEAPKSAEEKVNTDTAELEKTDNKALEDLNVEQKQDKPIYLDERMNQKADETIQTEQKNSTENEVVLTDDLNTSKDKDVTVTDTVKSEAAEDYESKFDSANPTTDSIDKATAWYKKEYGTLAAPINELDRNLQRLFLQEKYSYCKKVTFMSFDTKCKTSEQNKFVGFKSVYNRNKGADIRYSYQFTNYIPGIRVDYSVMKVDKELYKDDPVVVLSKTFTIDLLNTKHTFDELVSIEPF